MQIPIHDSFRSLTVMEYLSILWPERSQRTLIALFKSGEIQSRGKPVSRGQPLADFDQLTLTRDLNDLPSILTTNPDSSFPSSIEILHEDHRLLVLSKPSGVPVIQDMEKKIESCLEYLIRRELRARESKSPAEIIRYRTVHRIDRFTSGLVLFARTLEYERQFSKEFEGGRIAKEYLAMVQGIVPAARITVDCPIGPGRKGKMRALPASEGQSSDSQSPRHALTHFEVLERFKETTLVRARPKTGRTHQIRVHAWAAGHPLAIDSLYRVGQYLKNQISVPGIDRLTLHAHRYTLPNTWEAPRKFECPIPKDFSKALDALRETFS